MIWKLAVGTVLLAVVISAAAVGPGALTGESRWDRMASAHSFNLLRWEAQNILGKWSHLIREAFVGEEVSEETRISLVQEYLDLEQEIASLAGSLDRARADGDSSAGDRTSDEEKLDRLLAQRHGLEDRVEEIIASEGFGRTMTLGGQAAFLFPPVDFAFESRPNVLIVSPREAIDIEDTSLLKPHMTLADITALEESVDSLGYSALVEQVGAVATYPSIVPPTSSLNTLLSKAAHEWTHHHLFFRPLGRNYWSNYEMTTINETAADMAGAEIASLTYDRYYKGRIEKPSAAPGGNTSFDFGSAMRTIRVTVDDMLAQGHVEDAERYMEEQRLRLQNNGYYLRKLNQAYFAFHGTYADTPSSVSPIGDQMRDLRQQSDSLGDFLKTISQITDHGMLLDLLNSGGD